jgi:hypothetical protein
MDMWWQSRRTLPGGAEQGITPRLPARPWGGAAGTG